MGWVSSQVSKEGVEGGETLIVAGKILCRDALADAVLDSSAGSELLHDSAHDLQGDGGVSFLDFLVNEGLSSCRSDDLSKLFPLSEFVVNGSHGEIFLEVRSVNKEVLSNVVDQALWVGHDSSHLVKLGKIT